MKRSAAGVRDVALPRELMDMLTEHMDAFVAQLPDALLFTTKTARPIRRGSFEKLVGWRTAVAKIGTPGLHFHDLRHTGNMLAAAVPGTSTRDLMARMGHESMAAARIYQHRNREADRKIAAHLGAELRAALKPSGEDEVQAFKEPADGAQWPANGPRPCGAARIRLGPRSGNIL